MHNSGLIKHLENIPSKKPSDFSDGFLKTLYKFNLIFKSNYPLNFNPGKLADAPNSSSILNNWLYFAILSEREAEPVLI